VQKLNVQAPAKLDFIGSVRTWFWAAVGIIFAILMNGLELFAIWISLFRNNSFVYKAFAKSLKFAIFGAITKI